LHRDHSLTARAAFLHVLGDAVASVAVLASAAVLSFRPDWKWIDPALSLAIAAMILFGAVRLVFEIAHILMESVPRHLDFVAVMEAMKETQGVIAVHDLHIWTISSGLHALSAHLVVPTNDLGRNDAILADVKAMLKRAFGIDHTTIQIESAAYAHVDDVHTH
jgi:cobalt-zinc-cadmium efflux system protein